MQRCDQFGRDVNEMVPVKNLGELRWHSGCLSEGLGEGRADHFPADVC